MTKGMRFQLPCPCCSLVSRTPWPSWQRPVLQAEMHVQQHCCISGVGSGESGGPGSCVAGGSDCESRSIRAAPHGSQPSHEGKIGQDSVTLPAVHSSEFSKAHLFAVAQARPVFLDQHKETTISDMSAGKMVWSVEGLPNGQAQGNCQCCTPCLHAEPYRAYLVP